MKWANPDDFLNHIKQRDSYHPEFLQAVQEVIDSLWPFLSKHKHYADDALLERLVEPERVIQFRVCWTDDHNQVHVNRAYRVQHSSAIGPYKGGMRFHPSVNLSVLKFLAFEQTLKNALTTLPMGGGKGGSDFDPKHKSNNEIMRFCQALMLELHRHIGADTDVPAGDIGVGLREVGYMAGMMKKLSNTSSGVFTGKGLSFGGSLMRPEATGYGLIYFVQAMLAHHAMDMNGRKVSVSGSGNVAQYSIEKAMQAGAKVITASDSEGFIHVESGFTTELLHDLMEHKNQHRHGLKRFAERHHLPFYAGQKPWGIPTDIALPCATQNELNLEDAKELIKNGVMCVAEGANMPTTPDAAKLLIDNRVLFAPGKASNAGGVAVSGLEMSQNSMRLSWTHAEVDQRLQTIMTSIHGDCIRYGTQNSELVNYIDGANIAGFVKVADAMRLQGVY